ncbi:MAG: Crp/Fnr family transcriptional regulator [Erysipelotrichaceae bacterium]|nr:Crp/Fnr family transcriptional regulator [Erysipelotrichaceae bacterium]
MECSCLEEPCAKKISIFQQLDEESLRKISEIAVHRWVKKGEVLFTPGHHQGVFLIHEGKVKVYELSSCGKEQLLRVLESGEFTGEEALFSEDESYTYAEALVDSQVCFIERDLFLDLLMKYPSISLELLKEFNRRSVKASHQTVVNSKAVMERLVGYLLDLSKVQESDSVVLPMQLKELATFLSTTPETLSRRLSYLENEGYLKKQGNRKVVLNVEKLKVLDKR